MESFLIVNTHYPAFLEYFYNNHKEAADMNYTMQKDQLMAEFFNAADFYPKHFRELGYKADNIIANNEFLQKRWAKERSKDIKESLDFHPIRQFPILGKIAHNFPKPYYLVKDFISKQGWVCQVLEAQIREFRPDILYVLDIGFFPPSFLEDMKKQVRMIVGQIACPMPAEKYFAPYDLIVSSLPNYVEKLRKIGKESEFLKLGFEDSVLSKLKKGTENYDVVHVGSYGQIHKERNDILENLVREVKIKFWGHGINFLEKNSPILKNYMGQAWGLQRYNIFYNSKIVVTKHIASVAKNFANNETIYDATGSGAMLMCDLKDNLGEIFDIGKEIETYSSVDELAEKIKYYLNHEQEREKIAKAGKERTLKDHNYGERAKELISILGRFE